VIHYPKKSLVALNEALIDSKKISGIIHKLPDLKAQMETFERVQTA
jgi:hypothetical protein